MQVCHQLRKLSSHIPTVIINAPSLPFSPFSNLCKKMAQFKSILSFSILLNYAIIILNFPSPAFSLSSQNFQTFDVSASLQKTHQVFSSTPSPSPSPPQNLKPLTLNTSTSNPQNTLTLSLHPRFSLFPNTHNNYTSLTLSRLTRDSARVASLLSKPTAPQDLNAPVFSGASQGSGEYFSRIGVGQPVKNTYLVLDTGSDISWLQCQPCTDCYSQANPIYDPSKSSTYHSLPCSAPKCSELQVSGCSSAGTCVYQVSYGDGSSTSGDFGTDTLSFGGSGSVPDVAIGCGHDNEGLFVGSDGLLGLGGGELSLPSQIKATSFSYCLVDRDSTATSTLEFNAGSPRDSVLAPLLRNARISTYYYVGLEGFDVGGRAVGVPAGLFDIGGDGRGGVIVDSGTAVTRLRTEAYTALRDAFVSMSQDLPTSSSFALFDTCYDLAGRSSVKVPTVSLRFAGGQTLPLRPSNYLVPVDGAGKYCFAFAPTEGQLSIIGNLQQQGTRVSYDLASRKVGFSPNKC